LAAPCKAKVKTTAEAIVSAAKEKIVAITTKIDNNYATIILRVDVNMVNHANTLIKIAQNKIAVIIIVDMDMQLEQVMKTTILITIIVIIMKVVIR